MNIHELTVSQLTAGLAEKKFSSLEITQAFLDRIKKYDSQLNCFITVTEELALQQAKAADDKIAAGQHHPLTGIPLAHKDIFCTQGIKTSCGSKMLDNFVSPYDATLVAKLNKVGCVTLGKTNMDEFAMGSSNETSYYGPTHNPWHVDYVPGGSSGGSAAAVAALLAPLATGTDTGGSIRQPAALCGVTGLKPTYGRISRFGMIAFASSLDQAGPFARTAEDLATIMQVMAGHDPRDSTSMPEDVPNYTAQLRQSIHGLTLGLPKEYFEHELADQTSQLFDEAIRQFKSLGVKIKEISLPHVNLSVPAYYVVAPAECSSNLARFDGVRYGYRCEQPKDLLDLYQRTRNEGFGKEVKRRILIGTYVLSAGYYDAYYLQAQKIRRLIHDDFKKAFTEVDAILSPTAPTSAFKIGEKANDPLSMYLCDIFTIANNLAGLPGISFPVGFVKQLPLGMQLTANHFAEAPLMNIVHQYQQITDWHLQKPTAFTQ